MNDETRTTTPLDHKPGGDRLIIRITAGMPSVHYPDWWGTRPPVVIQDYDVECTGDDDPALRLDEDGYECAEYDASDETMGGV